MSLSDNFFAAKEEKSDLPDLFKTGIPTIDRLYPEGFLSYGLNLIAGPKGSRKTTAGLRMAANVAIQMKTPAIAITPDAAGSFPQYVRNLDFGNEIYLPRDEKKFLDPFGPKRAMEEGAQILLLDTINLIADPSEDGRNPQSREIGKYLHSLSIEKKVVVVGIVHTDEKAKRIVGAQNLSRRRTVTMFIFSKAASQRANISIESHRLVNTGERAEFSIPVCEIHEGKEEEPLKFTAENLLNKKFWKKIAEKVSDYYE